MPPEGAAKCVAQEVEPAADHEDEVGGDAALAGVQGLAEDDLAGHPIEVRVGHDDRRALPAEFQGQRRELLGGCPHDLAATLGGAGEQEVVEGLPHEIRSDIGPAKDRSRHRGARRVVRSRASSRAVRGASSEGLSATRLPAAIAPTIAIRN